MIGRQLGGYRIEAEIGRGGMGVVYLAEQVRLERKVALKVIAPEHAHDAAFRARFERESRLAASIDHPNVVPIHEAGELDGLLYIAMRYVRGTDLKQVLTAQGALHPARAADVVGQVAAALDVAHASGLVHRDVKPANILLEGAPPAREHAYLTDFGLTKRTTSASGVTQSGVFVGTIDYIAPEQLQGGAVDARTDVYALACVLYHALTGRVPYEREDDIAKMHAHANMPPPRALEAAPYLPPAVDDVIRRGMAKRIDERYASAGDLARAAAAAVAGQAATVSERSVATGAAAPGVATVLDAGPTADAAEAPTSRLPAGAPSPVRPAPPRPHAPPPRPYPPAPPVQATPPGGRGGRAALLVVAIVLVAGGVAAGLVLGTGGDGDSEDVATTTTRETTTTETTTDTDTTTTEEEERTAEETAVDYQPYVHNTGEYETVLPVGEDWSTPDETLLNDAIHRTRVVGPDGLEVIVDYTPGEAATFKPASACSPTSHQAFAFAERCAFRGGTLAPCQRTTCVDYLLNATEDGPGFGVLVGGGSAADAERIAERIADAMTLNGAGGP